MEYAEIISKILQYFVNILASLGGILGTLLVLSKKFRKYFSKLIKNSEEIVLLTKSIADLKEIIDKLNEKVETVNKDVKHIKNKLEENDQATVLTLKYEILDICYRAKKYGGITRTDKEMLCELYHAYVEVWHENHYVKSEASKVMAESPIIDSYEKGA